MQVVSRSRQLFRPQGTPQEMCEQMATDVGNKPRTKIRMLDGQEMVTPLRVEHVADMLSAQPGQLLLVPRRDDSGRIHAAYVRAGAIGWIEVA